MKKALILQEDEGFTKNLRGATTVCPGWGLDRLGPQTMLTGAKPLRANGRIPETASCRGQRAEGREQRAEGIPTPDT